jgi:hypothetical protein
MLARLIFIRCFLAAILSRPESRPQLFFDA